MASRIAINRATSLMYDHNLKYIKLDFSHLRVREWILYGFLSHFWHQSKVPNPELSLSERINGKFKFFKVFLRV